jgi:hypothetical protein
MIISLNPFTLPIWIGGLLFMFNKKDRNFYLPIALSIAVSILLLAFAKSKAYYFYPAILTLLIFGSIWLEQKVLERKKWTIYPISILLSLSGIVLLPFSLSVLPLETFIKYADIKKEQGFYKIDYSEYYSQKTWPNTLSAIKSIYDSLPASEKKDCMIWGKHYSQAGAVNLLGGKYDLPKAFSYHGSFYLWTASKGKMPGTILAFTNGEANIDFFQDFFYSVVPVKKVCSLHAKESKHACQTIFICKEPKQNFEEMREKFSTRVFE